MNFPLYDELNDRSGDRVELMIRIMKNAMDKQINCTIQLVLCSTDIFSIECSENIKFDSQNIKWLYDTNKTLIGHKDYFERTPMHYVRVFTIQWLEGLPDFNEIYHHVLEYASVWLKIH